MVPSLPHEQRSAEWYAARSGKVTASLAAACLGLDPNKGPLAAYNEIVNGSQQADNKHMAWGREHEDEAICEYEVATGRFVARTSFWTHPVYDWLGASPDGLVEAGLLEIKCPGTLPTATPGQHNVQMRVQMACTGRPWVDYFAWCGPGNHFLERLERSVEIEDLLLQGLLEFYTRHILPKIPPPRRRAKKEFVA